MPEWFGGAALSPDMLIPPHEQWQLQWDRVRRWYQRVVAASRTCTCRCTSVTTTIVVATTPRFDSSTGDRDDHLGAALPGMMAIPFSHVSTSPSL